MKTLGFGLALCLALGAAVGAQETAIPARLTLDEALRIADERNPSLVSARAVVAMAEADVATARIRPNPAFSFQSEGYSLFGSSNPPFLNAQELYLRADQEIELGGRRGLRTESAEMGRTGAQAALEDERRRLHLDVRRAYFQVVLARADQEAARATLAEIDKVIGINRVRLEQGEISGGELRRIQVERLRFMDDALSADLAARNARAALLALLKAPRLDIEVEPTEALQVPGAMAAAAAPSQEAWAKMAGDVLASALGRRPDLAVARSDEARAETETRLQRALRTPNLTIGGGYRRDFGQNGVLFSVTMPLPLFDTNAGRIARAEAERQLAASRVAATQSAIALDVQQAMNAVDVNRARVAYIEKDYLPNAREVRDIVQASYGEGAADLLDFLDAQRAYRETLRTYNRALFDYRVSMFQLEAATGR
ncbi:MAG: TolC family protein [Bacteroidales bacterium]